MVAKRSPAKQRGEDRSLYYRASMLRAHILECRVCKVAVDASGDVPMCIHGIALAGRMAMAWNIMVEFKRKAGPDRHGLAYICPEPGAHSESYALCAELYSVNGVQDRLF